MAIKSADQITIVDITDGYSISLSSETFTFMGENSGVPVGEFCMTEATALCGTSRCSSVTINASDIVCPTGISAAVSNNGTSSPTVTFTTTAVLTAPCEATIPVSVDGITINKKFSFGVSLAGPAGATGATGATGNGVKSTAVTYQIGTSATSAPTGTWSSSIVSTTTGQYLWTRTVITYTDNTTSTSYSVAAHGATGATGATGNGVKSTAITYQVSTSATTAPTGTWSSSIVATTTGQYLWTRTITTYTDNTTSTSYSVAAHGATGATGAAGADAITLIISASPSIFFKNSSGTITLTARVFVGVVEQSITDAGVCGSYGSIKWYKGNSTTAVATSKTLTITASEVTNMLAITAQLE